MYLLALICIVSFYLLSNEELVHNHDSDLVKSESINFLEIDVVEFEEKMAKKETFLVLLGNEDCDGCMEYAPILEKEVKEKDLMNRVFHIVVPSDKNKKMISYYGISVTPTTLIIKNGKIIKRVEGVQLEEDVQKLLEQIG